MTIMNHLFAAVLLLVAGVSTAAASAQTIPKLVPTNGVRQLQVDDKPWLILGGELANSSASSRAYMAGRWKPLADMHINTVLMPISWELIEPEEGRFDFSLVDGLLADARAAGLRVVPLWFGSWKNSMSSYTPGWVKRDQKRFPRVVSAAGVPQEILSPHHLASAGADAKAFGALMAHLARTDPDRTVIMVQVENETAMLPDARDHSPAALKAWGSPVPRELGSGSWTDVFGDRAEEAFSAWHFARYTEMVAAAGKAAYPLPLFVNAALPRPNAKPGSGYPAAGPLPHLADVWTKGAPSIDFLAPDIYYPNFVEWTKAYAALPDNSLFIPEAGQSGSADATANAMFAIGQLDAMGFSPFSIDTIPSAGAKDLREAYAMLQSLAPLILARQGTDQLWGARPPVTFDGKADTADQSVVMSGHRLTFRFIDPWTPRDKQVPDHHGGIVIGLGEGRYLVAGRGVTVTFAPADGVGRSGIARIDEGEFRDGGWVPGRLLNGDESHQGRHLRLPPDRFGVQMVELYRYR